MGMMTCVDCEKEISDKVHTCPGCGHPYVRAATGLNMRDPVHILGVAVIVVMVVSVVFMISQM